MDTSLAEHGARDTPFLSPNVTLNSWRIFCDNSIDARLNNYPGTGRTYGAPVDVYDGSLGTLSRDEERIYFGMHDHLVFDGPIVQKLGIIRNLGGKPVEAHRHDPIVFDDHGAHFGAGILRPLSHVRGEVQVSLVPLFAIHGFGTPG
jgi:hypothetical protein